MWQVQVLEVLVTGMELSLAQEIFRSQAVSHSR
jgi:hypothetical protein